MVSRRKKIANRCIQGAIVLVLLALGVFAMQPDGLTGKTPLPATAASPVMQVNDAPQHINGELQPRTLAELLALPVADLSKVDIARMNLLCAIGLPGAEALDKATIDRYLSRIDRWAARVKHETERHLYRLTDPRYSDHAEHYQHSEARFRAEWLVMVLQDDIGVHYHSDFVPADEAVPPFRTSKETFIHGLLGHEDARQSFGGNCVSKPVIYAAVAHRLGYPVQLVTSREHVFCRWMGKDHANVAWQDEFNFDGTGKGFSIDPDSFYMTWPGPSTPEQVELYDWLKPLSPAESLSVFLLSRGHVFRQAAKDEHRARVAYAEALRYRPTSRMPLLFLADSVDAQWRRERADHPQIYRARAMVQQVQRSAVTSAPSDDRPWWQTKEGRAAHEAEVMRINEANRRNMQSMGLVQPSHANPSQVPFSEVPFSPSVPQHHSHRAGGATHP